VLNHGIWQPNYHQGKRLSNKKGIRKRWKHMKVRLVYYMPIVLHLPLSINLKEYSQCRNPTLAKGGGEAQHLEKLGIWSSPGLPNVQSSTTRGKTPRIGVFLVSLKRY